MLGHFFGQIVDYTACSLALTTTCYRDLLMYVLTEDLYCAYN